MESKQRVDIMKNQREILELKNILLKLKRKKTKWVGSRTECRGQKKESINLEKEKLACLDNKEKIGELNLGDLCYQNPVRRGERLQGSKIIE